MDILNSSSFPWEMEHLNLAPVQDGSKFITGGFVLRLFSGSSEQEESTAQSSRKRSHSRVIGIQNLIDSVDETIARSHLDPKQTVYYNHRMLHRERIAYWNDKNGKIGMAIGNGVYELLERARDIVSETDKYFNFEEDEEQHEKSHEARRKITSLRKIFGWYLQDLRRIWRNRVPADFAGKKEEFQNALDSVVTLSLVS